MVTDFPPDIVDRAFETFREGETASFEREITVEDLASFAALSGDRNPLHTDESYAAAAGHLSPVAYGLLVATPISTLAGHLLPGKRCLLLEASSQFRRPVFPYDRLTYCGTITRISPSIRVLKVQVEVSNQQNAVVLTGAYVAQVSLSCGDADEL